MGHAIFFHLLSVASDRLFFLNNLVYCDVLSRLTFKELGKEFICVSFFTLRVFL